MTIWNRKEWEEMQKIYADHQELMTAEIEMMMRRKCLVDRAWNIYYEANKYPQER